MSDPTIHCRDYVNQPYQRVRDTLFANPHEVFRHATTAATKEAATLHVRIGVIDVGTDVAIEIRRKEELAVDPPASMIALEWSAASGAELFPTMKATLVLRSLAPMETELEFEGQYHLPLGKLGVAIDSALGHRLAEVSVARFVHEVATWLREQLAMPGRSDKEAPPTPPDVEC